MNDYPAEGFNTSIFSCLPHLQILSSSRPALPGKNDLTPSGLSGLNKVEVNGAGGIALSREGGRSPQSSSLIGLLGAAEGASCGKRDL